MNIVTHYGLWQLARYRATVADPGGITTDRYHRSYTMDFKLYLLMAYIPQKNRDNSLTHTARAVKFLLRVIVKGADENERIFKIYICLAKQQMYEYECLTYVFYTVAAAW